MNRGRRERFGPAVLGGVASIIGFAVLYLMEFCFAPKALPAAALTFGVVVAGFSATQRNMLLGMGGSRVIRFLVDNKLQGRALAYLMECVCAGLTTTVAAAVGFFLGTPGIHHTIWLAIIVGLVVWVVGSIARNELAMRVISKRYIEEMASRG